MTQIVESMEHVKDVREAVRQGTLGRIMLDATILVALCDYAEKLDRRVSGLEAKYVKPSQWRCDGCGCVDRPDDGRRPDAHPSCGGMWIREERT